MFGLYRTWGGEKSITYLTKKDFDLGKAFAYIENSIDCVMKNGKEMAIDSLIHPKPKWNTW